MFGAGRRVSAVLHADGGGRRAIHDLSEEFGTLVARVGTDSQDLLALTLLREDEDQRGKALLRVVAFHFGKLPHDQAAGCEMVVHDTLASVDSCQRKPVEQGIEVGGFLLPRAVLLHGRVKLLIGRLGDVEQRNEFRRLVVDRVDLGVRLEPSIQLHEVDTRRHLEGVTDISCEERQPGVAEQGILTDRLLELVADCLRFGCREGRAQRVGPLARVRNGLESTDLVRDETVGVELALRVGGDRLNSQRVDDLLGGFDRGVILSDVGVRTGVRTGDAEPVGVDPSDDHEDHRQDGKGDEGVPSDTPDTLPPVEPGGRLRECHGSSFRIVREGA